LAVARQFLPQIMKLRQGLPGSVFLRAYVLFFTDANSLILKMIAA